MADGEQEYRRRVCAGLDRAYAEAPVEERELDELRMVVFSDLHRGARDGADDFERCEPAYNAALGWYLEHGYELFLLGDIEELWENDVEEVLPAYADTALLEQAFHEGPGLRRFFGNHDATWRDPLTAERWLADGVDVLEALRLRVVDGDTRLGELFFVHGHQGTDGSDRGAWLARLALRRVWRKVQRTQGWLTTTPSQDNELRYRHDQAMFHWARSHVINAAPDDGLALIAGHTHRTVFPGRSPHRADAADIARLAEELARAPVHERAARRAALERARASTRRVMTAPLNNDPPCYFNTGCCCFPDRYVTGLEIAEGQLRLVRWRGEPEHDEPQLLAPGLGIRELLACLATA